MGKKQEKRRTQKSLKLLTLVGNGTNSYFKLRGFSFAFSCFLGLKCCLIVCLVSLADDHQALIWDIQQMPRAIEDPILAYTAEGEINNVQWASTQPDWIAICYNNCLEILRV